MTTNLKAGRELDSLIADRVMGIPPGRCKSVELEVVDGGMGCPTCLFASLRNDYEEHDVVARPYSTDIGSAWKVVERILSIEKANETYLPVFSVQVAPDGCSAVLQVGMGYERVVENSSTAPLAICLAALKVLEVRR